MDFRESFRDSLMRNPTSQFKTHWDHGMTTMFGINPPCNAATQHQIFEDKIRRNY